MMTQELIANMLGSRRESVTLAAGHLQDMGTDSLLPASHHHSESRRLQASSCECYRIVEYELARQSGPNKRYRLASPLLLSSKPVEQPP